MIRLIADLIENGHAYAAEGHVLFHVPSMPDYGKLSNRSLDDMIAGARVEVAPYKKDSMDFVLWKPSKEGEPAWPSPWSNGRPGWHIECSAMAGALLGDTFDIHGGGIDLIFPHHENEIAQSRCAHGTAAMANYWLHNGFLQVEGEKMSKSTGNFVTIWDLLGDWPGEVVRFNMLRSHYRQPMDWTVAGLEESSRALATFYSGLPAPQHGSALAPAVEEALTDDLNTPKAITELFALHRRGDAAALAASLAALGFTGDLADPRSAEVDVAAAERLISARAVARKSKNFAEADRIRLQLDAMGVQLKDAKDPKTGELVTTWEVKR
jgi:cysteinyl-tRNA synthetase